MTPHDQLAKPRDRSGFDDIRSTLAAELRGDEQSGLLTRSSFERLLNAFSARASQRQIPLSLAVLEVAEPPVSLRYGRPPGEASALVRMGGVLGEVLRSSDPIGRLSERLIAVLLPGCRGYDMEAVGLRIQRALDTRAPHSRRAAVRVCIGLAESPAHQAPADAYELYQRARWALELARATPHRLVTSLAA